MVFYSHSETEMNIIFELTLWLKKNVGINVHEIVATKKIRFSCIEYYAIKMRTRTSALMFLTWLLRKISLH